MKGHYTYTQVIVDSEGDYYLTPEYMLCSLCNKVILRDEAKKAKHKYLRGMALLLCDECYTDGTMIKAVTG